MSWILDTAHTSVKFSARHMMISTVAGQFSRVSGTVDFDEAAPEKTQVHVKIAADSLDTKDERRDAHLKSPDFLDVANYPDIEFKSTGVERTGERTAKLHGDLTIRGVTRPVTLDVEYLGKAKSPWGTWNAGFEATGKINREDWGLNWNMLLETGGWLVGKEVKIEIAAELIQQQEQPAAVEATPA
ncbi:MAG: polyisoprenoid-binding protein [Chloroflexi bacterium]|jgi:polyisoprenoid-binding protein YceI|uniref:Polyisoprenoid-binding protein n=1 Tax=Candidatus Thermofonsia Clade 3 bacterium TaxID=2364212 RepID=A0A2M8QEL4_9CHLR|nr:YceI family protein [Candidatus Roseilinea sp. NK_OTU-006]PJF48240.1 MAG: polyisoprenoid-binding protein [Candidatus Thermofonsia Clade 3 bacterium]RMG64994.1 MAG: polyisoprenoid-binding protein [Chloroflexota bacterium]